MRMPIHLDFKVDLGECLCAWKVMKDGPIEGALQAIQLLDWSW